MFGKKIHGKTQPATVEAAVRWFVELDARGLDAHGDAELSEWLARDPDRAGALARCEAVALLTAKLRDDTAVAWAFDEAADVAAGDGPENWRSARPRWYQRPAPAWAVAGLFAIVAVGAFFAPRGIVSSNDATPGATASSVSSPSNPLPLLIDFGTMEPAVMLPGAIPVDARAIAVMPFAAAASAEAPNAGEATIAADLYTMVLRQLERIPGLYVVGAAAVEPYVDASVSLPDIAAQLGVRGIVQAHVASADGRVQAIVRLVDATNNRLLVDDDFDGPISEMPTMRTEIAMHIAAALAKSSDAATSDYEPTASD